MNEKAIRLRILKPTSRYPIVGFEFDTPVDAMGTVIDPFLRRRLADIVLEHQPLLEVVKKHKSSKTTDLNKSVSKDHITK